jgi:hypothetical protein
MRDVLPSLALVLVGTAFCLAACSDASSGGGAPSDAGSSVTADAGQPTADSGGNVAADAGAVMGDDAGSSAGKDAGVVKDAGRVRPTPNKIVFATRAMYTTAQLGGGGKDPIAEADARCNAAALASGLGGTWKAWLSTTSMRATDHLSDVAGGWYNMESTPQLIFQAKPSNILPGRGVFGDELGNGFDNSNFFDPVWTGTPTSSAAPAASDTCNDWTSSVNTDHALGGDPRVDHIASWTAGGILNCNGGAHLYCFEQ